MVEFEDITLEKPKTRKLPLEINALSDTFNQNVPVTDNSSETPRVQALDRNNKSKPQIKNLCSF